MSIYDDPTDAAALGMMAAFHANRNPEKVAVVSHAGKLSYADLNTQANRLVRALRARGIKAGDALALVCSNRGEFIVAMQACSRAGLRLTPINWHLTGDEIGYIVDNCEAKVLVCDQRFAEPGQRAAALSPNASIRLAIDGGIEGFEDYATFIGDESGDDIDDPILGGNMLYTSGTTGRPKGVYREPVPGAQPGLGVSIRESALFDAATDMALVTGPAYHAAPFGINIMIPIVSGVGVVLMDKWDAEETLALIDRHRATHTHMVATMFHRMLALPASVREKYDLSSMRWIIHGAAPCPIHVKRAMIDWFGPVLFEYYAATEGGNFFIDSATWLNKPGSVGRGSSEQTVRILNEAGEDMPTGESGTVYFEAPREGRFQYFKAPEKTDEAYRGDYFTMGDIGYFDEDGYLFLSGRSAETIISGGVNIYPQEIDDVLMRHPDVHEVCTIGIPDDEWGESILTVIELRDGVRGDEHLTDRLIAFAREHLPGFKVPRRIEFAKDLPRMPTGKIQRHKVRAAYWEAAGRSI
ncbi:MAG: AMP-binding protein [Pseudomonadota bacterium]